MGDVKLTLKYKMVHKEKELLCGKCRNSNQGTVDKIDGLIFCKFSSGIKSEEYPCIISHSGYLLFEEYDGTNCTWAKDGEFEVVTEE
jgi:hypothetical protein